VLATGKPFTGGPYRNLTGHPTIFMSVPVLDDNGTLIGVIVSQSDPGVMAEKLFSTQVKSTQFVYIVNESGTILIHNNQSQVQEMADFSSISVVKEVIAGKTGVMESYNPVERDMRLSAYAPVPGTGWGVIVALPMDVVQRPAYDSAVLIAVITALIALAAGLVAWIMGKTIADPIVRVSTATKKMTNGGDYQQYLPLDRNDEIGELARSFDEMSRRIAADRERIIDEKNRAELYIDILGHDINNMNQTAMGNLELAAEDPGLPEDDRKAIRDALNAVMGSADIIDNVRKIQRINEEKLDVVPEDLDSLVAASIRDSPRPPGKKVIFDYRPAPGSMVRGNPLLKEAICNLIGNSIKYSGEEVAIGIRVDRKDRAAGPYYELTVEDNGHGIPDDVKPKLFRRLQRGTTKVPGKGLGLYIVRSLVEKLGGSVRVEDRVQGDYAKGAKFVLELPAHGDGGR
jgi:signal transduction histidine kinase